MNKDKLSPTQLIIRIVIIVVVLVILLLVGFSMIKLVPKVFTSITDIKNLLHKTATSTPNNTASSTVSTSTPVTQPTQNNSSSVFNVSFTNLHIINGKGVVTFNVTNTGGQNTGPWKFSATLPRSGITTYNSPLQTNIPSGKTSVLTLNFDAAQKGIVTINIAGKTFTSEVN